MGHALIFYPAKSRAQVERSHWIEPLAAGFRTSYNRTELVFD